MKIKALVAKFTATKFWQYTTSVVFGSKLGTTLLIIGIIFSVLATFIACFRAGKMKDVWATFKADRKDVKEDIDANIMTKKESAKAIISCYGRFAWKTFLVFVPVLLCTAISILSLLGSHNIMIKKTSEVVAAASAIATAYDNYRARVVEEYGEDVDRDFALGIKRTPTTVTEVKPSGKEVTKKAEEVTEMGINGDPYARIFAPGYSLYAQPGRDYTNSFLVCRQSEANEILRANGTLTLNEVYDMLGYDHTSAGAIVGWTYPKDEFGNYCGTGKSKGYVDFGLFDVMNTSEGRRIIRAETGAKNCYYLTFNVDGVIWQDIDKNV